MKFKNLMISNLN